jgi:hypothetical protein
MDERLPLPPPACLPSLRHVNGLCAREETLARTRAAR